MNIIKSIIWSFTYRLLAVVVGALSAVFSLTGIIVLIKEGGDPVTNTILSIFLPILSFCAITLFLSKRLEEQEKKRIKNLEYEERLARNKRIDDENREKELLRSHVDLILEKVDNRYRLKLLRGDNSIEYLCYKFHKYDFPSSEKPVHYFMFQSDYHARGLLHLFSEVALPTLKNVIIHYQRYGNLDPAPPVIEELERFVISRPEIEPPPDLTGIDTIHDLVPILLEAERDNNHYGVNKVLDKMDGIRNNVLLFDK